MSTPVAVEGTAAGSWASAGRAKLPPDPLRSLSATLFALAHGHRDDRADQHDGQDDQQHNPVRDFRKVNHGGSIANRSPPSRAASG